MIIFAVAESNRIIHQEAREQGFTHVRCSDCEQVQHIDAGSTCTTCGEGL